MGSAQMTGLPSALPGQSQGTFLNPVEERLVETEGCGGVTVADQLRAVED